MRRIVSGFLAMASAAMVIVGPAWAERGWLDMSDPSITQKPSNDFRRSGVPEYPPEAWRKQQTGDSVVSLCVTVEGLPVDLKLVERAPHESLNVAALEHAKGSVFTPAKVGEKVVPVCGYKATYQWRLPGDPQPVS